MSTADKNTAKAEKNKTKPEKTKGPKKPRDTVPVRKYKDAPAGHFVDVVTAMGHKLMKTEKKTAKWGIDQSLFGNARMALAALALPFAELDKSGFKPKRGGISATFQAREIVTLSPDAIKMLNRDFPELTAEHVVSVVPTYAAGDKQVPIQSGGQFLGRVSYKWLTGSGEIEAEEEGAAETEEAAE